MSKYNSNNCLQLDDDRTFSTIYNVLNLSRFEERINSIEWQTRPQYTLYYLDIKGMPSKLIVWGYTTTLLADGSNEFFELVFNL